MIIFLIGIPILFLLVMTFACCKIAGDADEQEEGENVDGYESTCQ